MPTQELKRIDIIGNSNNYPLTIAHGLRNLGIEAHIHLIHDTKLNAPEHRFPIYKARYPEWIHDWRGSNLTLHSDPARIKAIKDACSPADALILNHEAVHLGAEEQRPYFCLLTGTDLVTYCNPKTAPDIFAPFPENIKFAQIDPYYQLRLFYLYQRLAIRLANGYSFFPRGLLPKADELLESLGADPSRQISLLVTDLDSLHPLAQPHNNPMKIIYGARLTWDRTALPLWTDLDYKGTDVFLQGFAKFIATGRKAELTLFRKGIHITQTEELVASLNLKAFINWQEEASPLEFLELLGQADVVVDHTGSSHIGMVVADAMALARPVIAKTPDSQAWNWPESPPICHASTPDEACQWLIRLHDNPALREEIGQQGRSFSEKYFSATKAAEKISKALLDPKPQAMDINIIQTLTECLKKQSNLCNQLQIPCTALGLDKDVLQSLLSFPILNRGLLYHLGKMTQRFAQLKIFIRYKNTKKEPM